MTLMVELTAEEVHREIPYSVVCMGRYGSSWNTMHRKRRWAEEFTESDRAGLVDCSPKLTTGQLAGVFPTLF